MSEWFSNVYVIWHRGSNIKELVQKCQKTAKFYNMHALTNSPRNFSGVVATKKRTECSYSQK